jgi:flagellar hook-basal body complex protein FliE
MASPTVAANAYASLARMMESGGAEKGGQTSGGSSFSALLKDAVGSVLEAGKKSDAQTMAMTSGKANVMDVVTAVAETDVAVSTLVSVRDRVIQAYEDIMKMPI